MSARRKIVNKTSSSKNGTAIQLRGVRVHNLQNIDADLPHGKLVVITGPSGSGKSSLAFDTLYAEGQRQYLESLSLYARQFFHQLERPDVDLIEGLPPTLSVDQRVGLFSPRSTVATATEIYDYLRLLYAKLGTLRCPKCLQPIQRQSAEQVIEALLRLPFNTRVMLLAPFVRGRKGEHKDLFVRLRRLGFVRARVDGQLVDLEQPPSLARQRRHNIEAVVDRLVIRPEVAARVRESVNFALQHAEGALLVCYQTAGQERGEWQERLFSTRYACPSCQISVAELEPRTFSFNSPYGACPTCDGLGVVDQFDPELLIQNRKLPLGGGAMPLWDQMPASWRRSCRDWIEPFLKKLGALWETPLADLGSKALGQLLRGDGKEFTGLLPWLEERFRHSSSSFESILADYRSRLPCPDCGGARLRPEARAVTISDQAIHELTAMTVEAAQRFIAQLTFSESQKPIARPIVGELLSRLDFLRRVGVDYLTLDRPTETLSGGELQRVRLASSLGAGLVGVCYILDEPSIGLHPRDNARLIEALRELQQHGNTVIVVEHDESMIRAADWVLDLGPGAGRHGGRVVAAGTPADLAESYRSITGQYLSGRLQIPLPRQRRSVSAQYRIRLEGVRTNNLKNITVDFPLGVFICVTGVSGAGKSSLISETLARALRRHLGLGGPKPGPYRAIRGADKIDKVVEIDPSPIGRTPRSTPATYIGVFDHIRRVFAGLRESRERGYKPGRFSFNVRGGRCEACEGHGQQCIEMTFLPDLYVSCPACQGKRFNPQTLEVTYRGKSIADILEMSVEEAIKEFQNFPIIQRLLRTMQDVGLGYLTLGQASPTLSGGEAQRIKLAAELSRVSTGRTLYILDEPTIGLHSDDIRKLLQVLNRLVDAGNTVIIIEHHLDVIKTADWIIDLGPEGGDRGGYLLAAGRPEELASLPDNLTGRFLRSCLEHTPTTIAS